jgi:homoserine dehydrogenase
MHSEPIVVLKFGSSVLASDDRVHRAVHEIYRYLRRGYRVVAVTSAVGRATEHLLHLVEQVGESEPSPAAAALLSTGELASAALLSLALDRAGIPAALLDPRDIGFTVSGPVWDGEPSGLDKELLEAALLRQPVAVVPGFFGRRGNAGVGLLGRGGSDLTALYLAHRLGARCRLLKDVDGLFERDPRVAPWAPRNRYVSISWDDAVRRIDRAVQHKALRFAARHAVAFEVAGACRDAGTQIGPSASRLEGVTPPRRPFRVALLGLGQVGRGVAHHLLALPETFAVSAIAVRDPRRHYRSGVPPTLLSGDPWSAVASECEVVVEALGGCDPAASLVRWALSSGRDVVSANKELVATEGVGLARLAQETGSELRFSAAVGGAVPMLERVRLAAARGRVISLEGVLNGTTNFVLDRLGEGESLGSAVAEAQRRGFAEADPACDLDGRDVLWKLQLLARVAFGRELTPERVARTGIGDLDPGVVRAALAEGDTVRLVARCALSPSGREIDVRIGPERLSSQAFLAQTAGAENRLVIGLDDGSTIALCGKGAGRWPTAEAVLADLLDLADDGRSCATEPVRIERGRR